MTKTRVAGATAIAVLVIFALGAGFLALRQDVTPATSRPPEISSSSAMAAGVHPSFLVGRVTNVGGVTYEGRLRWGGDEEAFWGDSFNGRKSENPWVAHIPHERLPNERRRIELFGIEIGGQERETDLGRPFMARFGDISRIEARGTEVRVVLKSGTVVNLNRLDASDFDDGVRVWDRTRGVVDLDSRLIRTIELLPSAGPGVAPHRLHGTVRTRPGNFTGFVQWDRDEGLGVDQLEGRTADGEQSFRFDTIRSIERASRDSSRVTLVDGREIVLSGTREISPVNRGIYVDDPRYGRVMISWDTFERIDFRPAGSGPAYDDFPPGRPLTGSVTIRDGGRLTGRLVFDLDESETTETLDAPSGGVDYMIPFGLIASIDAGAGAGSAKVILHGGEELLLERAGDLGDGNGGMLIFANGQERPEYVPWTDVERLELDRPPAMYPPIGARPSHGNPI